ncbi:MAG: Rdx family protein [Candidatus Obscuribacter sp.]|nr:Rdx family protein [Candidatus Obscuribacter sp.]
MKSWDKSQSTQKSTWLQLLCGGQAKEPRAEALAAEIGREFGVRVEMHRTVGGVFEVDLGDSRVFSKILLGRFPEEGEVVKIMKAKLGE